MARINKELNVDIRLNFNARMRSLGKAPDEISLLSRFLELSLDDINDLSAKR